jgi:N-acyl-D-amino-acid deacylase
VAARATIALLLSQTVMSPSGSHRAPFLAVATILLGVPSLAAIFASAPPLAATPAGPPHNAVTYEIILRHGTIVDGSGAPRHVADVAIDGGRIARIGDLSREQATTDLDVRGLFVAPGFINVHSHAIATALPVAENMLTQGVTTELLNADGSGPLDIAQQLERLERAGLAVNVAASVGFNSVWSSVMGPSNRRPSAADIEQMRLLVVSNLERGAFGVSAGLDYKPAYFATTDEVIKILEPAASWRTFFPNHDRSTPETGFSSRAGIEETIAIGTRSGLIPVITHMKMQGRVLEMMRRASAEGRWVAADVYPYLAGQTALFALIIPGWAQDGGLAKMRERFRDSTMRARIIAESNEAISARFNGAESIVVGGNEGPGRKLSDIMREQGVATPGEAVVKVMETESPTAVIGFGLEADLVKILQYPAAAVACDCGATIGNRGHPRYFGTFPRVLGHYVRETRALTWEDAVRKMSGLPASMMGLVDRGLIAPGMAADIVVFDTATVIDRATFEQPDLPSEGIRHVLVNGRVALRDGKATGERGGVALRRTIDMPSRPMRFDVARDVKGAGELVRKDGLPNAPVTIAIVQRASTRQATGTFGVTEPHSGTTIESLTLGTLQTAPGWASITGRARLRPSGVERSFTLVVEERRSDSTARVALSVEGLDPIIGSLDRAEMKILPAEPAGPEVTSRGAGSAR